MIHLVYVSSATHEMSEQDLIDLLEQSRTRNNEQNISGMLLYAGGNFFQVLEGDEKDVDDIYASIIRDNRNTGNIEILKETIDERTFPGWTMGFAHLTRQEVSSIEGYSEFLGTNMEPTEFANRPDKVLGLLYKFKRDNI